MQRIGELIRKRAEELLADGTVSAVIGWKKGEFFYDETPAVFRSAAELGDFVYDGFSAPNLSKYLIKAAGESGGKILALLKPCDTYSFNQLVKEHRVDREKVYALGVECRGMLDIEKIRGLGIRGILGAEESGGELLVRTLYGEQHCRREDVLLEKCAYCKSKTHALCDELLVTGDTPPEGKKPLRGGGTAGGHDA
jgi:coenzyme F420-reducing hydrogenase beta subunit